MEFIPLCANKSVWFGAKSHLTVCFTFPPCDIVNSSPLPGFCRHGNAGLGGRVRHSTWPSLPSPLSVCLCVSWLHTSPFTIIHHLDVLTHVQLLAVIFSIGPPHFASLMRWTRCQMSPALSRAKFQQSASTSLSFLIMLHRSLLQNKLLVDLILKWEMNCEKVSYISEHREPSDMIYLDAL